MIQAGEAIDASFGVMFGLSTLTAAGFGQCCSDVAGITCGGIVDSIVAKLNLPRHGLSQDQLDLRISRTYSTVGGCIGVVVGCLLGMSCLLFMDTERAERAKKAKELQSIFESVMNEGNNLVEADRATLFMLDEDKGELWSRVATGTKGIIKCPCESGVCGSAVTSRNTVNIADAYHDSRFNPAVDRDTGYHTSSILAVPIKDEDDRVIGVIEVLNKKGPDGTYIAFSRSDEKMVEMLASHVAAFIRIVNRS